ncbi:MULTISPECIES: outer membrane beta-barrel protein [Acidiphilium]|uniref:outer membrane beta-barrel protein n=2 Tax=Acidocellaceae TaxID=3385905 RepID=UPI00257DAEBB|nr:MULTISPECIES: outer membrane beta-barrel protein [Acidiphilium]
MSGVARAQVSVKQMTVDGGPLGTLDISGGFDGDFYGFSGANAGTLLGTNKSTGAVARVLDLKIVKPTGPVQFTVEVKPDDSIYFGYKPGSMSTNTFTLGPVYAAYVTLAPTKALSISVGQVYSTEGWESSTDWNNANIIDSPLYYVENSSSRGVAVTYTQGPISGTVTYGDGFDSGVFNVVQGLVTYSPNANNAASVYGTVNFGRTGPNTYAYGNGTTGYGYPSYNAAYVNSNMIGAYYDYTYGNLNLVPEVQYVYAKVDHQIGIDKFTSNFGAELIADYKFPKTPWSVGGQVMYYSNNGPEAWYLNAHSAGLGLGVTPTWQKGNIFARGEVGLFHLTSIGTNSIGGTGSAFGGSGTDRNQVIGLLEAGVVF